MIYFVPLVASFGITCLWVFFCVPAVCRISGVPLPFNVNKQRTVLKQLSSARQLLIEGVLAIGIGMFIFSTSFDYVQARMRGRVGFDYDFLHMTAYLAGSLLAGVLIASLTSRQANND